MTSITETYLWSALITLAGFGMVLYFWLYPIINAKLKYMFMGGQGTLNFSPDAIITLKVQNTNRNDCVLIHNREKPINPNFKQHKFMGIPCNLFVPAIPTNADLKFTKNVELSAKATIEAQKLISGLVTPLLIYEGRIDYTGIQDRDIDTHISNMQKDPLREFFLKYKNYLLYSLVIIVFILGVIAYVQYQDHQILKTCGVEGSKIIKNAVVPN